MHSLKRIHGYVDGTAFRVDPIFVYYAHLERFTWNIRFCIFHVHLPRQTAASVASSACCFSDLASRRWPSKAQLHDGEVAQPDALHIEAGLHRWSQCSPVERSKTWTTDGRHQAIGSCRPVCVLRRSMFTFMQKLKGSSYARHS